MPTTAKFLGLRLFLDGVEVPVIGATVSAQVMGMGSAQIEVPYTDEITELKPRTVVHLFFHDMLRPEAVASRINQSGDWENIDYADQPTEFSMNANHMNPHRWKLLFTGEYVSYRFVKRFSTRQIVLICSDFTSYWDSAKLYYGTKGISSKYFKQAIFMGSAVLKQDKEKRKSGYRSLLRILKTKPSTVPRLQGLLGGLIHLLETITGVYRKKLKRRFRGANDFLAQAELRLKLTHQLGVSPHDDSSRKLTGAKGFRRLVKRASRQLRGTASYRQLVDLLLGHIYHMHSPVLAPPYRPKGSRVNVLQLVPVKHKSKLPKTYKGDHDRLDEINKFMFDQTVVRDRETNGRKYTPDGDYIRNKPVVQGQSERSSTFEPDKEGAEKWSATTKGNKDYPSAKEMLRIHEDLERKKEAAVDLPKKERKALQELFKRADLIKQAHDIFQNSLLNKDKVTGDYPAHNYQQFSDAQNLLFEALKARRRYSGGVRYKAVKRELELSDRLITTLFAPEIWMVPPPRCNVLFPDQYSDLTYGRNFLTEVTRLWLHGLRRSGRANWSRKYFAPNIDMLNGQIGKKTAAKAASQAVSFLMPHERFTGIVPAIEGIGNTDALNKLNKQVEKKEGGKSITSWRTKDPAMARAANYMFFKKRFASRTLQAAGPFNPGLVVGMPGMVLDPRIVSLKFNDTDTFDIRGKHILGLITSLRHRISQQGVTTSLQMGYCRAHDEELNIFGKVLMGKVSVIKKITFSGGRKIPAVPPAVAEVYGWKRVKYREKNKLTGEKKEKWRLEPIIGMGGKKSRVGKHVTAGLLLQPNVRMPRKEQLAERVSQAGSVEETHKVERDPKALEKVEDPLKLPIAFTAEGKLRGTVDLQGTSEDSFSLDLVGQEAVSSRKMDYMCRVSPIRGKSHTWVIPTTESSLVPTKITESTYIDGYHYTPRKRWMGESKAILGSVDVNAYVVSSSSPKVKKREFKFSFEQIARPPWFSDIYLNQNIGTDFYLELLGCQALTDLLLLPTKPSPPGSVAVDLHVEPPVHDKAKPLTDNQAWALRSLPNSRAALEQLEVVADIFNSLAKEEDLQSRTKLRVETLEGDSFEIPANIIGGVPIEVAAKQLAETYAYYRADSKVDINHFVETYTARKFASMPEIFGYGYRFGELDTTDPDLDQGDADGAVIGTFSVFPMDPYQEHEMFEEHPNARNGFHSRAFGGWEQLSDFPNDPLETVDGRDVRKIDPSVDTRAEKLEAAATYRNSVTERGREYS